MQALLGDVEFFIPGATRRDQHDDLLVLHQLALWADERENWPSALAAVETALRQAADVDDLRIALGLAWAALLVGDDIHEALLTDNATQLARRAATSPGYPAETEQSLRP